MSDRCLPRETVDRAVEAVDPEWTVRSATPVDTGTAAVVRLTVGTSGGRRDCVLKASTDEGSGIDTEARLLALLSARTDVPVPEPLGAVDDREGLPTPLLLMSAIPGESVPRTDLDRLHGATATRIARQVGRSLADVHRVDAVDGFGYLEPAGRSLEGERPPADPEAVRVVDGETDWRAAMRRYADRELVALAESRFADRHPEVEAALHGAIDRLEGPFEPALAHVDGLLENVRIDDGDVVGVLDWGFTVAATPGYDLVHVAGGLDGGIWTLADPVSWGDRARGALVEGYAERAPSTVVETFRANRSCYELLRLTRTGAHLEEWLALGDADDAGVEAAAAAWRDRIRECLDRLE